jgi:Rnl2 family RNA ligase
MFKKWVSIENTHNEKFIRKAIEGNNDIKNMMFTVQEKIDGANMSVIFYPDGHTNFAKRSDVIKKDDNFYNYKDAFKGENWDLFQEAALEYCFKTNKTLQFIGELYGLGVQKRIFYGTGKYWKWYGIYELNDENTILVNYENTLKYINDIKPSKYFYLPVLKICTLDEALSYDIEVNSTFTPEDYNKKNIMEGIVIRPVENVFIGTDLFILKLKNKDFMDRHLPKEKKEPFNVKEDLQSLYDKVSSFVCPNRTTDLFSKYGPIESMKDFGKYLGYYMIDINEEIKKYYPLDFENLEKEEKKWLHKQITLLIKKEIIMIK